MKRVLAIGAHPDDVEVGAGGLLQRAPTSYVLVASAGERGGNAAIRDAEAQHAMVLLRADGRVLRHHDTAIVPAALAADIEAAIRLFSPDTILTMSPNDGHQDHAATAKASQIAVRDFIGLVLAYCTPSAAERFTPNWFVGLSEEDMQKKQAIVACHASQAARPYMAPAYLEATGRYWAHVTRSAAPFIEPYELLRYREK